MGCIKDWFAAMNLVFNVRCRLGSESKSLPWVCTEIVGGACYLLAQSLSAP